MTQVAGSPSSSSPTSAGWSSDQHELPTEPQAGRPGPARAEPQGDGTRSSAPRFHHYGEHDLPRTSSIFVLARVARPRAKGISPSPSCPRCW